MPTLARLTRLAVVVPLAALLSVAACHEKEDHDQDGDDNQQFTPPLVSATTPLNADTGVAINRKMTATFSEAMDASTITTATFTVTGLAGAPVAGKVTYVVASRVATFTPNNNLDISTVFTATITTGARDLAGNALASAFVWTFTTGITTDTTAPTVISTIPAGGAINVANNTKITATFSKQMDPLTLTSLTFTLKQGTTSIPGTVTYADPARTATFATGNLTPSLLYTATVSGAQDLAGNALLSDFVWSFTTGSGPDLTPPTVTLVSPTDTATNVALNASVNATFSKDMDPATVTNIGNFSVMETVSGTAVPGSAVTYDANSRIATFIPNPKLKASTKYTATITTGVKDLAGNAMASPFVWSFTTGTGLAPGAVSLKSAAPFGCSGGPAGMTNQGVRTVVNGDILTTGASTLITGFHDGVGPNHVYTETTLNVGFVNGTIFTAAPHPPGPANGATIAQQALSDANDAFIALSPAAMPGGTDPGAGELGGLTLPPGIYKSASGPFKISLVDLTLDAKGNANAVWVFQMASSLTVGTPAGARSVILINGAQPKNVFWQVGSAATINGAGGGTMVGTIIAQQGAAFSTAGNDAVNQIVTLNGRALGLTASVTLVNTIINVPLP